MSFEAVDVYVQDSTPEHSPLVGVTVKVLSQDGTQTFTLGVTDSAGHVGFLLPSSPPDGTTYQLRAYQFGTSFTLPQYFTVLPTPLQPGQTNAFTVIGTICQPPDANDIRLCVASGYFRDTTGAPQSNLQIHFIAKFDPLWVDGAAVLKERVVISTDRRGWAQVNLFRNAQYDCTIQGEEDITRTITVPDQANVNMADLIFPIVEEIILTPPPPYTLSANTSLVVGVQVIATNGQDLGTGYGDVRYSTTDQGVVGFAVNEKLRQLTLLAGNPGVAQILVKRSNRSIVHLPYSPVTGQPVSITVTP